ncbi:MAG: MarR family transcriptional regulator [Thermomonas sp.]|uniref:MarR family winged helix-turn-helix transcriptional regulator n=1 Tax=Thermomonas sp. TaxID=1971895 RepID=UPI001ECB266F|nr:MarR family transcriptional regulator [Thermomonas sp.]MBV2210171.1 MarR family transcriptional regulator [Thermomonas sp.]
MNTPTPPDAARSGSALGLLFRQTRDAMWARMEKELAAAGHDLNFSQFITLKYLATSSAGVTDLARLAYLNPGAMTRLLDKLEARGLLERRTDPNDRRALNIHLTPAGKAIWSDIEQCGQRVRECALHGMDEATRIQLTRLLEQVRDNLTSSE